MPRRGSKTKFGVQKKFQAQLESVVVKPIENPLTPTSLGAGEQGKVSRKNIIASVNQQTTNITTETGVGFTIRSGGLTTGSLAEFEYYIGSGRNKGAKSLVKITDTSNQDTSNPVILLDMFSTSVKGNCINIVSSSTNPVINISSISGIYVASSTSLVTPLISAFSDIAAATSTLIDINQEHASCAAISFKSKNDGTGTNVLIDTNGTGKSVDIDATSTTNDVITARATALTTGKIVNFFSLSTDASTRSLVEIKNSASAATGTVLLTLDQQAPTSTNFKKIKNEAGVTSWVSNGTTPNGNLSGTAGDTCKNGTGGQMFYCTGTTNWTGM